MYKSLANKQEEIINSDYLETIFHFIEYHRDLNSFSFYFSVSSYCTFERVQWVSLTNFEAYNSIYQFVLSAHKAALKNS